jgi:predicted dehydrogenase
VVANLADVLEDPEFDLVDICLPPQLHFSTTSSALEAGKHAICEKPITGSIAEVRKIAELARKSDRSVFPVFQYRYGSGYRRLHELKKLGLLGTPYTLSLETHWQRGADYYSNPWRGTWQSELGGVIVSHACHAHNLATHLLGNVVEVAVLLDTRVNPIETEDCASLSMRTEQGALVTSSITLGAAGNMSRFRACFEKLTVTSGLLPYQIGAGEWTYEATDPDNQADIERVLEQVPDVPIRFEGLFADIQQQLTSGTDLYLPSLEEAAHSTELITAIYASARNKEIVQLPLRENHPLNSGWLP